MAAIRLSVVSPTYNEAGNLRALAEAVSRALEGVPYELLIVDDDSPDLTWQKAEEMGRSDPRVRAIRRRQNRGLGNSVIDGFVAARGEAVACIDADLQHDPAVLPQMLQELDQGSQLVVACRYTRGGGTADWSRLRRLESQVATKMAQWLLGIRLKDPMSGYFMMRRQDILRIREELNGEGFKILLEIVAKLQPGKISEVPYTFRARVAGESKVSRKVVVSYLKQLYRLSSFARRSPRRP